MPVSQKTRYEAVVIGASAGGMQALKAILPELPAPFYPPIAIVQHVNERSGNFLAEYLGTLSRLKVKEAEAREKLSSGSAYLAPAGYHLLIEPDRTFSLSVDPRVNYACPSIDVLFESAAETFGSTLIGVVLTGANADGARGLKKIRQRGGRLYAASGARCGGGGLHRQSRRDCAAAGEPCIAIGRKLWHWRRRLKPSRLRTLVRPKQRRGRIS
jgi:two-component system chemotaxis response regulator CheB